MNTEEVVHIISNGETSRVQFKENVHNETSIGQEMVAFSNSKGGIILIGVNDKDWTVSGLQAEDLRRLDTLLSNAAQNQVKSPIVIDTEVVDIEGKKVLIVNIPQGVDKPYMGNLYAEEMLIQHSSYEDLNWDKFQAFYEKTYQEPCEKEYLDNYLQNLRLGEKGKLNLAGALLFTNKAERTLTGFFITAIWFWGNDVFETDYRSSENLKGTLSEQYRQGYDFVMSKLQKVQDGQSFNSLGKSEIPEIVIQELLVNALIHRDYFIHDTIKLFVFQNRIEIISPGRLPNNLTEAQIKRGIRKKRNNILDSFAPHLLNYRGAGSGILRALKAYPAIDFENDIEGEQFKAIIYRPDLEGK